MNSRILKAIKHPDRIISRIVARTKQLQITEVTTNGELFYRYKGILYPEYLNHGDACQSIAAKALTYCQGKGIDIGADKWPLSGAIPIQDEPNRNAYKLNDFEDSSLDFVFSSHCVEHLSRWEEAITLWISKLKMGGFLFLYLPHETMKLWNPGGPWVGYSHKWQPRYEILLPFLSGHGMEIVEYNPDKDRYWSFHIVCKRISI